MTVNTIIFKNDHGSSSLSPFQCKSEKKFIYKGDYFALESPTLLQRGTKDYLY